MTTAWRDLAVDDAGDLLFTAGDFAPVQGDDAIAQECATALRLFVGEYPFDTTFGADWPTLLSTKGIDDAQVDAEIRRVLATVTGVASVDSVSIVRDTATRDATIVVAVIADSGAVLQLEPIALGV